MSIYIYSVKIVCVGTPANGIQNSNLDIGFVDDTVPVLLWSESRLRDVTVPGATLINGYNDTWYAPILTEMGDLETTFEIDNPVIQISSVDFTVANHDKIALLLQVQGVVLSGLPIQISLNEFDPDTGVLISSEIKFYGEIVSANFGETELNISCENNKHNRKSKVLKEGEMLSVGLNNDYMHFALNRIDTTEKPAFEVLKFGKMSSFLVLGYVYTFVPGETTETYSYQILSDYDLQARSPTEYAKIIGSWALISDSPTSSKGEYRKILSFAKIEKANLYTGYASSLPSEHHYQFTVEGFYSNRLMTAGTPQDEPDLQTLVQFVKLNFEYYLTKIPLTGAVDDLFIKSGDGVSIIERSGWDMVYSLASNHIVVSPKFIKDNKTALTYTVVPCPSVNFITDTTLIKWQHSNVDDTKLYGRMYKLTNRIRENYYVGGLYFDSTSDVETTGGGITNPAYLSDKVYSHKTIISQSFKCQYGDSLTAIQLDLPDVPDDFNFKACYLGLTTENDTSVGNVGDGVKIMSREANGSPKVIAAFKMNEDWAFWGQISTVPPGYFTTLDIPFPHWRKDWQEEYIEPEETTGMKFFTNYKKLKIDVSTVEEYRRLDRIGLFFARKDTGNNIVTSTINIHSACIIFEHETDLSEVYI